MHTADNAEQRCRLHFYMGRGRRLLREPHETSSKTERSSQARTVPSDKRAQDAFASMSGQARTFARCKRSGMLPRGRKGREMLKNRKIGSVLGAVAVGVLAVPMALGITGCSGGATAATVNGEALPEQTVTDYIAQFRQSNSLTDDTAWAQWMVDNSYDASSIRDTAIDYYVRQMVIQQDAKSKGVEVTDQEVDDQVAEIRSYYQLDDEGWKDQLESVGYTEDTYRDYVKNSILSEKLEDAVITDVEVTDDEVLEMANMYASYIDGGADIDVIAMPTDNPDAANNVANQIKDGTLSFDDAKAQNSTTDDYDGIASMTGVETAVSEAVANMAAGDISDVITGTDNLYIVRCNEIVDVPDGEDGWTSIDQLPQGVYDTFYDNVYSSNSYTKFDEYVQTLIDGADVQRNELPEGMPYDVSTDGLTPSSETTGDATATADDGSETTGDGAATDEGAATDDGGDAANEGGDNGETSADGSGEGTAAAEGEQQQ